MKRTENVSKQITITVNEDKRVGISKPEDMSWVEVIGQLTQASCILSTKGWVDEKEGEK